MLLTADDCCLLLDDKTDHKNFTKQNDNQATSYGNVTIPFATSICNKFILYDTNMRNGDVPKGATVTELVTPFEQSTSRGKHVKYKLLCALTGEAGTVSDALEDYLHAFSSYVSGNLDPVAKAAISVCAVSRSQKSHEYKINQLIKSVASFATPDEVLQKINTLQLTANSHSDEVVLLLQDECSETTAHWHTSDYACKFSQYNANGTSNPYCSQWWAALEAANKAWFERVAYSPWVFDLVTLRGIHCFMESDQKDGEAIGEPIQYVLSLKYWNDWETILDSGNADVLSGHRGWKQNQLQAWGLGTEQATDQSVSPLNQSIKIAHKQDEYTSPRSPRVSESAHSDLSSNNCTEQM